MRLIGSLVTTILLAGGLVSGACAAETAAAAKTVAATETSVLTLGLRGGYDSNPTDGPVARASAFSTTILGYQYLNGSAKDGISLSLNAVDTYYDPRVAAPSLANSATFNAATLLADTLVLRGTLAAGNEQTWSRRRNAASARLRLDYELGDFRLFGSVEAGLAALNERNYFALGAFLPRDENAGTLTVLPGIAYRTGLGEFGVSLTAAKVAYLEDYDYLGFRRDNDRLQPNLFYSGTLRGVTLEGSLSALDAVFPDKDFDDLRRLLFTAKLKLPFEPFVLELASSRTAQDTTLPFSAIDIVDLHEAKLSWKLGARSVLALFARAKSDDYTGLGAKAVTRGIGLEYAYNFASGLTATAQASLRRVRETGTSVPDGFNIQFGLQRAFSLGGKAAGSKTSG
jgi:hypothetical protein